VTYGKSPPFVNAAELPATGSIAEKPPVSESEKDFPRRARNEKQ
jgi:hypothetical protein